MAEVETHMEVPPADLQPGLQPSAQKVQEIEQKIAEADQILAAEQAALEMENDYDDEGQFDELGARIKNTYSFRLHA
jgi:hypothetical protein